MEKKFILWFKEATIKDVPRVGGKNASLGEMYQKLTKHGVRVPNGFATTADAYWYFLEKGKVKSSKSKVTNLKAHIKEILKDLDVKNIRNLQQRGRKIRQSILKAEFPADLEKVIIKAYRKLSQAYGIKNVDVAVRSSATAEDMPSASFAGQMESYLGIKGEKQLLKAVKKCVSSLFTDRAISYRQTKGFGQLNIALSVGVQKMVRSDLACSGVMFSCDTESGFADVTVINSSWGLGENVVKGRVTPDEFMVFEPLIDKYQPVISKKIGTKAKKLIYGQNKQATVEIDTSKKEREKFTLTNQEILELAKYSVAIEKHYGRPMDMEWAKDGQDKKLYIVQARPETVQSRKRIDVLENYVLLGRKKTVLAREKGKTRKFKVLTEGVAVGSKIGQGEVNVIKNVKDISKFKPGQVLVAQETDPDWEPIMKIASAIVTDRGGRTCFSGQTKILTDKGFLTIKEITQRCKKENFKVLSLNRKTLKIEWQRVIDGMERVAPVIKVSFSQTGRAKDNFLTVTPDHKFLTFKRRRLITREIKDLLVAQEFVLTPNFIPPLKGEGLQPELAYLLGGISTDGHIYLSRTHGEITFIQKPTKEKKQFIEKMGDCLKRVFNYTFHVSRKAPGRGYIRGKLVCGNANAYRCYSKRRAQVLLDKQKNLVNLLLSASEEFIYEFLAGVTDGDGTYNIKNNKINIFCSKDYLLEAIIIACLRLNINFQVTSNRNIYNIQIVDKVEEIFAHTARVKGTYKGHEKFGLRLVSARQLLDDIKDKVNYQGRINQYIDNNLLIDIEKIKNDLIPMIAGQKENHQLTQIVNSDLKMLRAKLIRPLGLKKVYNITVEENHNYVVFTSKGTPLVVNNCHAAIVSRELGIPCVVGTGNGTSKLKNNQPVTVSCAEGETGFVYQGLLPFKIKRTKIAGLKRPKIKVMMNVGSPEQAFAFSFIPNDGVGLAREEFIINNYIKIHPLALLNYSQIKNKKIKKQIDQITIAYENKVEFYIDKLAEGIGKIAAAFYPKDVIVRFSDFKSNEYANLIGGKLFEPEESNPMIGWRGASRYYSQNFKAAFKLECQAVKKVRQIFGLDNVIMMVPFCRTVEEGKKVLQIIKEAGLKKTVKNIKPLKVYVMCEIPSNVILGEKFAKIFDGFSIGSNDLTQLTLGLDRDSSLVAHLFDENNPAIKRLISQIIKTAHRYKRKVGICGQAPSDIPGFAEFLVEQGIDSISLNPDTVLATTLNILKAEKKH